MCKLQRRITHKLNIKLYSVSECYAGVYTSITSTKIKLIPIINQPIQGTIRKRKPILTETSVQCGCTKSEIPFVIVKRVSPVSGTRT